MVQVGRLLAAAALMFAGCGSQNSGPRVGQMMSEMAARSTDAEMFAPGMAESTSGQARGADAAQKATATERKIIYAAHVTLVVEDFSTVESSVAQLVKRFDGYIAESNLNRTQGTQRTGKWVVRIAVDRFDEFLDEVVQLGVPENRHTNAQDVTEEFVDLEARLTNKKEIERRIVKLLEDRSGDIKDVIAVEAELGRVREEIERMQGRLRYLANMTAFTTVTINAREQQKYVPPQAPTFTGQIAQTWSMSVQSLEDAGKAVVLAAVAAAPWVPLFIPVLALPWILIRRRRRPIDLAPSQPRPT